MAYELQRRETVALQAAEGPAETTTDKEEKTDGGGLAGSLPHAEALDIAREGVSGAGGALPYGDKIQRAFGHHDVGGVKSHQAPGAAGALGAEAYALGDQVAFGGAPTLHTAAHEAAHVVQQRQGVSLKGGVGESGDAYEKHADAVADQVVAGESAESTLDQGPSGGASGVQRKVALQHKKVKVSDGNGGQVDEDTERVEKKGNQFEDGQDVIKQLEGWVKGTVALTGTKALALFYQATPAQRNNVWMNKGGIFKKLIAELTHKQSARVMGLCDFPLRWKINHWYDDIKKAGGARELIRSMISNSAMGQRVDVVSDETVVARLQADFKEDHPENLFGVGIKDACYPTDEEKKTFFKAHPKYAKWAGDAERLDAVGRWQDIATDPATKIAEYKGKPAKDGRDKWTSLLHWGGRGAALSKAERDAIDKVGATAGVAKADRESAFLMRFNVPIADAEGFTFVQFKTMWEALASLPAGTVTSDTVSRIVSTPEGPGATGSYTDVPSSNNFGDVRYRKRPSGWATFAHTVRHEIGHQVDTKTGGFSNFVSRAPAHWRKWNGRDPWLRSLMASMKTSAQDDALFFSLLKAYMSKSVSWTHGLAAPASSLGIAWAGLWNKKEAKTKKKYKGRYGDWQAAADAFTSSAGDLKPALDKLKGKRHSASGEAVRDMLNYARTGSGRGYPAGTPKFVGDRFFGHHYEYHSWHKGAEPARAKTRDYAMCSPYEFYADLFAKYFSTSTNRAANVPAWAAAYYKKIAGRYNQAAMDDTNNSDSMAYSFDNGPNSD